MVAGECKGDVWVDNIVNPTLALVYSFTVGGFSIMGSPNDFSVYDDFIEFLRGKLFPELKSKGVNYFEFSVESKSTEDYILKQFSDENMNHEEEYFYRKYDADVVQDKNDFNIVQVDQEFISLLQNGKYYNPEFLKERLLQSWGSYEEFFAKSVAYVATIETSIIGVIVGTARYQDIILIDIETRVEHRKKGLAYILTQYFVKECIQRSLVAQWNCVDSNIASRKTVEKAGFKLFKKKPYYWFKI
ncbi:GNAT family N-acetyltransferase [Alkaliphilus pronyensis]|uniref:GNAT family N-acetyltransferase n=1 Tax=Alkaliphilus pronyensis TaxID=1482732 RepID=UPI002430A8B5|nr:GNAT family N-acetyltransferase [Alkaliphilus pronyensis]